MVSADNKITYVDSITKNSNDPWWLPHWVSNRDQRIGSDVGCLCGNCAPWRGGTATDCSLSSVGSLGDGHRVKCVTDPAKPSTTLSTNYCICGDGYSPVGGICVRAYEQGCSKCTLEGTCPGREKCDETKILREAKVGYPGVRYECPGRDGDLSFGTMAEMQKVCKLSNDYNGSNEYGCALDCSTKYGNPEYCSKLCLPKLWKWGKVGVGGSTVGYYQVTKTWNPTPFPTPTPNAICSVSGVGNICGRFWYIQNKYGYLYSDPARDNDIYATTDATLRQYWYIDTKTYSYDNKTYFVIYSSRKTSQGVLEVSSNYMCETFGFTGNYMTLCSSSEAKYLRIGSLGNGRISISSKGGLLGVSVITNSLVVGNVVGERSQFWLSGEQTFPPEFPPVPPFSKAGEGRLVQGEDVGYSFAKCNNKMLDVPTLDKLGMCNECVNCKWVVEGGNASYRCEKCGNCEGNGGSCGGEMCVECDIVGYCGKCSKYTGCKKVGDECDGTIVYNRGGGYTGDSSKSVNTVCLGTSVKTCNNGMNDGGVMVDNVIKYM